MGSPTLLLIRMNAAETRASSAIADWTPLTVVPRSLTTAEIDTFIIEVSITSTNIAIASKRRSRGLSAASSAMVVLTVAAIERPPVARAGRVGAEGAARSFGIPRHLPLVGHLLGEVVARPLLGRQERPHQPQPGGEDADDAEHGAPLLEGQRADREEARDVEREQQ